MDKRIKNYPEAIPLYQSGLSVGDVAAFYGVSRQAMWEWMGKRKMQFRSKIRNGEQNHFHRAGKASNRRATAMVERAIEKGLLIRPSVCEACGKNCVPANNRPQIEAHHPDYNKPLEVKWLCKKCHFEWHKTNKAIRLASQNSTHSAAVSRAKT